jgi:hypothetical protein
MGPGRAQVPPNGESQQPDGKEQEEDPETGGWRRPRGQENEQGGDKDVDDEQTNKEHGPSPRFGSAGIPASPAMPLSRPSAILQPPHGFSSWESNQPLRARIPAMAAISQVVVF